VSQAVALRGPGRLALKPPAALLGLAFAAAPPAATCTASSRSRASHRVPSWPPSWAPLQVRY